MNLAEISEHLRAHVSDCDHDSQRTSTSTSEGRNAKSNVKLAAPYLLRNLLANAASPGM